MNKNYFTRESGETTGPRKIRSLPHLTKIGNDSRFWLTCFFILLLSLIGNFKTNAQTTLINPATGGGFESGATFADNGWTTVNASTDAWSTGTVPTPTGARCAYVSTNSGTTWTYSQVSTILHLYREYTLPAGENKVTLSFKWKVGGEGGTTSDWDNLKVFIVPVSVAAPTQGTAVASTYQVSGGGAVNGMYKLSSTNWNSESITFSGTPGDTYRLVFSWKSDVTDIANPPAALDDISLVSAAPGNYVSIASGNWNAASTWDAGSVPSSLDNATVSTGHTVTVNAAALSIKDLNVSGILSYGTTPTSFGVLGNLTVNSGGTVNVFNGSTGKALSVTGNILNNGTIDLSVGSTTAGSLTLNGTTVQTVGGSGTFNTGVIRNLIFSNTNTSIPNINWQFNNIKIAYNLDLTGAKVNLGSNKITYGNNAAGNTLTAPAGTGFLSGGKFSRWWTAAATGTSVTAGTDPTNTTSRYPFVSASGLNRSMWISRTNATGAVAGELAVVYTDASTSTTGLTVADGAYTINERYDGSWAVSNEGTAVSAGSYILAIVAPNAYFATSGNSRIMFANGALGGTHQNGTATPGVQRIGVSQTDLLSAPLYIGIASADVSFVSIANGNWSNPATWNKNAVPTAADVVIIANGTNVALDGTNVASTVTVNNGGTLTATTGSLTTTTTVVNNGTVVINGGTVAATTTVANTGTMNISSGNLNATGASTTGITNSSIGVINVSGGTINLSSTGNNNRTFTNNGTLTVTSGTVNVFGNMIHNAGSTFNQSGGDINIDGNNAGLGTNSVASGTHLLDIVANAVSNLNLSGGMITIVDPPQSSSTSTYAVRVSQGGAYNSATTGHTLRFGDGVSNDSSTTGSNGFYNYLFQGSFLYGFGNVVVNAGTTGVNRFVKTTSTFPIKGNLTVTSGEYQLSSTTHINGNLVNNGTVTATSTLSMGDYNGATVASTNAQSISGSGLFRNLTTAETAKLTSLTINNSNATGVTLNVPLSLSGTLTLTEGKINTTDANLLTLGTATAAATVSGGGATAYVNGPLAKTIATANTNSTYSFYPVGKVSYAPIWIAPTTTSAAVIKAETFESNGGSMDPSIINLAANRRWEAPIVSGTVTDLNVRLGAAGVAATSIPVQAQTAAGIYTNSFGSLATQLTGTPNTTQSNTPVVLASYTGYLSFADSNACSGTPNPGNTIASSTQVCLGTVVSFSLQNTTSGTGVSYVWESSTDGVTYTPISGATVATYSAAPTVPTYYRAQVTCSGNTGTSSVVQITFNNTITATTPASRCGVGTVSLEAVASAGATVRWYDATSGGSVIGTGSPFVSPSINANTTYYTAAETSSVASTALGAGATPSSSTAVSFFPGSWGGAKTQYIIRASELLAAGWGQGTITSLGFEPTNSGQTYQGFFVSIGQTATTTAPSSLFINTGLTQVYAGTLADNGFTPVANTVNTLAFGTGTGSASSFNWDGVSNLVISISWSSVPNAGTANSTTMKADAVGFAAGAYRQRDNISPAAMLAETSVNSTSTSRPRFLLNGQLICSSPRVAVLATVNTPPALTLSAAPAAFCSGGTSTPVTLTAGSADYDVFVWSPSTGVSGNSTTGWMFNPAETTTYTLTASQSAGNFCSTTASVVITVNPLPSEILISPSLAPVCVNAIQELTATGGFATADTVLLSENFNAATNGWTTVNNSTGGTPALTAWTLRPDAYAYSTYAVWHSNDNSQFYLSNSDAGTNGSTTATLLQSPSFSTVGYASATLKFFSYLYDNSATGGTIGKVQASVDGLTWTDLQTLTPASSNAATTFVPVTVALTPAFVNKPVVYVRFSYAGVWRFFWGIDNVSVTGAKQYDLTWSPATNLYTDAAATIPYVADTNATTVYYKSTVANGPVNYTVTSESDDTCTRTATVAVTTNALPVLTITNPAAVCAPATVDLTAAAVTAGSDTGLTLTYWTNANATTAMATPATAGAGTFYIKAVNANGCSTVSSVVVTVNALPSLVITNPTAVCSPSTVDITAAAVTTGSDSGLTLTYWADPNATVTFPDPNAIASSGTFYIKAANANGCSVISPVVVVVNVVAAPTGDATQSFDNEATVADLEVNETGIKWYDAANAGVQLTPETVLVDGGMYYASQTVGGCESTSRFEVTVTIVSTIIDYANLQYPGTQTINQGGSFDVYAQVYDAGVTEAAGASSAINAWIGYSSTDENPNSASFTWIPASFNPQSGNNDEYTISLGATLPLGTYYYASRFQVNGGDFVYGGYSSTGGGFWNGTTNVNGVLTVQVPTITYANLQFPGTATITVGGTENIYAQVYALGITEAAGAGSGISAWIGYSSTDENPNSASFTWVPANFNTQSGNNDEFSLALGSGLNAGTYYYASRFQLNGGDFAYGGYSSTNGGFWNGTTNVNGVLTVNCGVVDAPTGTAIQDFTTGQTLDDFTVVGQNIIWYDAATNGNVLPDTTVLVSGTEYYASQTINGCESATRLKVTAGVDLRTPEFNSASLRYYPNPVSDILTVSYSGTIEAIEIFNVLGQKVYQKAHNSQEVKIDMSSLATGNYIVNVIANGLVKNIKVIKK